MLALSFLAAVAYAFVSFAKDMTRLPEPLTAPVLVNEVPKGVDVFDFLNELVYRLFSLAPVLLVGHLFSRAGESMRRIGFDLTQPRSDFLIGLALAVAAHAAAIASFLGAKALHIPYRPIIGVNADAPPLAIVLLFLVAITAAVTEEVIVNAYLITRLQELGWTTRCAIAASAVLRGAYHLYQGVGGFVGNLVGGTVAGLVFVRTKRIMPLVIAHFLIDLIAFFGDYFYGEHLGWLR